MIDEAKLIRDRAAGLAAEQEFRQTDAAFAQLREQYVEAWTNSDPRDTAGREKMWLATTVISQVQKHLRNVLANGRLADKELEALRKAGEPKKRILGLV